MSDPFPSFRKPPVIEVVIGVQFAPLESWRIPHFGLYWQAIRDVFPKCEVQPPITTEIESFDPVARSQPTLQFMDKPEARCWYLNKNELLQVQRERFIYNWRKLDTDIEYPRYERTTKPRFEQNWKLFCQFLKDEEIGQCKIVQAEVTYVNHIPKGDGWDEVKDWWNVFTIFANPSLPFVGGPDSEKFQCSFLMPERQGRLRVSINHALRQTDGKEVINLNVMARGKPASSDTNDILKWLDMGHEWVVRGFAEITSKDMHALWERET